MKQRNMPERKHIRRANAFANLIVRGEPKDGKVILVNDVVVKTITHQQRLDAYYLELSVLGELVRQVDTRGIRTKINRSSGSLGR